MKTKQLSNKKTNYLAWSFCIPFGGMLIIMLLNGFSPFGTSSMLYSDCYHQYFPFFKAFCESIRNGNSLIYSWNVGMGMDYLGLIAYYLASPLYILGVLIPSELLLPYFSILAPIRLGLAGLFFAIFLKKIFHKNDISICIFGSFYALCAWAMGYQWNVMWMDTFALLPLVALGVYYLLSERKFILYTFSLFLSIFSNYYIGFFTCIFVFLVFICYEICRWEGFKELLFDLIWIATFSILAIGLSAVLELPAFTALQTTQSSVNKYPETFSLNIADRKLYANVNADWEVAKEAFKNGEIGEGLKNFWSASKSALTAIFNAMRKCAGNMYGGISPSFKEGLPNLYCGIGTIIFSFLFLTSSKVKLRDKLCSIALLLFFLLSFIIRQLDYIWHGFHFTNMIPYRFSFLYSFVMLYMAYRAYLMKDDFKLWQIITACVVSLGFALLSDEFSTFIDTVSKESFANELNQLIANWSWSENDFNALGDHLSTYAYPVYNGILLAAYIPVLVYLCYPRKSPQTASLRDEQEYNDRCIQQKRVGSLLLTVIMCVELGMNLLNFTANFGGTSTTHYPRGKEDAKKIYQIMHDRERDTLFYRAETTHSQTLNDGALNGYNGISTFTSSANVNVTKFMKALGYGAKDTYNRYCFEESSPIANLFLDLKYMIERSGNNAQNQYFDVVASSEKVYLLQNNAYLPLGFLANSELAEIDFQESDDSFEFQSQLLSAASGISQNPWFYCVGDELSITSNEVSISSKREDGYCSYTATNGGKITYIYSPTSSGLFCIDLTQSKRNNFTVSYNGKQLYSETYSLPQMLSVCNVVPGDQIEVVFTCKKGETGTIDLTGAILKEEVFRNAYNILNASTLQLTKFKDTKIEGRIDCNRSGILYTSIPQNADNWSVIVDGKDAEITLIGECMIGIYLSEGIHNITFIYQNPAFLYGSVISLVSLAIVITLWVVFYKPDLKLRARKNRKGKYQK